MQAVAKQFAGKDPDVVDSLRRSRALRGERRPMVVARGGGHDGDMIDGRHRKLAGWRSQVVLPVKNSLEFYLARLDFMVQRKSPFAEEAEVVAAICAELAKGGMAAEKVGPYFIRELSPWSEPYTYSLVPDIFKGKQGPKGPRKLLSQEFPNRLERIGGVEFSPRPLPSERRLDDVIYPCPRCGCPGPHA